MRAAAFFVACAALRGSGASATKPPHLISVFADDLGWYDTAIHNEGAPTPALKALASEGYVLERHYVFRYCSPSRRSFLSGRFPTSITSVPDHQVIFFNTLSPAQPGIGLNETRSLLALDVWRRFVPLRRSPSVSN